MTKLVNHRVRNSILLLHINLNGIIYLSSESQKIWGDGVWNTRTAILSEISARTGHLTGVSSVMNSDIESLRKEFLGLRSRINRIISKKLPWNV